MKRDGLFLILALISIILIGGIASAQTVDSDGDAIDDGGLFSVRARLMDKDGGFSDYTSETTFLMAVEEIETLIDDIALLVDAGLLSDGKGNALMIDQAERLIAAIDRRSLLWRRG